MAQGIVLCRQLSQPAINYQERQRALTTTAQLASYYSKMKNISILFTVKLSQILLQYIRLKKA